MRILVLTPGAYGVNGGIALYNRDIIESLAAMDEVREILLLPREIQMDLEPIPLKVRHIAAAAAGKRQFVWQSVANQSERYDLIICGHVNLMPLATPIQLRSGCPLVLMVYGIDVWDPLGRVTTALLGRADVIWSISEITRDRMNAWARLAAGRYAILPNAIHLDRYSTEPRPDALRARLGLEGRRVLLTLARLPGFDRYKGVDEVLECLPELVREMPDLAYVVAGDGEDRPRLEQKARDLGVANRTIFTGYVREEDKADFYRLADMFVMPGRGEGFGFVFLEALACGTPVIGSRIDGSREALRGGLLGSLVDPRELDEVKSAIRSALSRPKSVPEGLDYFAWPAFKERVAREVRSLVMSAAPA